MKVILNGNIENLGAFGEIKEVSDGYARNFLIPQKKAAAATPEAVKRVEKMRKEITEKEEKGKENLEKLAKEIQGKKITIKSKAKKGKLFGSVTVKDIAEELKKENFSINEDAIILEKPIKETGEKEVVIELGKNIKTKILLVVEEE
ncbi:MAG: 50S ribosomal protein L9 [bacterium]|nr:50S ribosomal protein L9 [bacterium]